MRKFVAPSAEKAPAGSFVAIATRPCVLCDEESLVLVGAGEYSMFLSMRNHDCLQYDLLRGAFPDWSDEITEVAISGSHISCGYK